MPIVSTTRMTAEQFLMLGEDPPGVRLELVDGEVAVSPTPTPVHSYVVVQLLGLLWPHIQERHLGELYKDVNSIVNEHNVRRPDVLYFSKSRTHLVGEEAMEGPPDLAVGVISPSSVTIDRRDKFNQYRDAGVRHYWVIDPGARTLDAWQLIEGEYVPAAHFQGEQTAKLAPFPDLPIPLSRLWRRKRA